MKVIGIGFGKTGTTSLGRALEFLGFSKHLTINPELVRQYAKGHYEPILDQIRVHDVVEDWPFPLMYREIFESYPEAMYVLTTRSSVDRWYQSVCNHALRHTREIDFEMRKLVYGYYMPHDFQEELCGTYVRHLEEVSTFFSEHAPQRFLQVCWENGDGWEELCNFLGKPIPNIDFPIMNRAPNPDINAQSTVNLLKTKIASRLLRLKTQLANRS